MAIMINDTIVGGYGVDQFTAAAATITALERNDAGDTITDFISSSLE
jgi:hypothetical protein